MNSSDINKIINACNNNNINFSVISMMPTYIRKNEDTIIKVVGDNLYGFRKPIFAENNGVNGIEMLIMPLDQLCEFHITANYDEMKSICDEIGVNLDDEELKLLLHMDKFDSAIEPVTGNYNGFRYITGKAYELLSDEEKEEYNTRKEEYEKQKADKLGHNQAASFTI